MAKKKTVNIDFNRDYIKTRRRFLNEFVDNYYKDYQRFCFILGAGASISSGIESGISLARRWVKELYELEKGELPKSEDADKIVSEWATADNIGIRDFNYSRCGEFYPKIYKKRFLNCPSTGFKVLEDAMDEKEPSFGYAVLASILANSKHKVAITTNFDNLIADALSIHSDHFPLILGHDSLAEFVTAQPRRPLVIKIHGAVGLSMKSTDDELAKVIVKWQEALTKIFEVYTPIVIGHAGNDGSLLEILNKLEMESIYWLRRCDHAGTEGHSEDPKKFWDETPEKIRKLIVEKNGALIHADDFDEIMLLLSDKCVEKGINKNIYDRMKKVLKRKIKNFDKQVEELQYKPATTADADVQNAAKKLGSSREDKPWWTYQNEIDDLESPEEQEKLYRKAIEKYPKIHELFANFANFLSQSHLNYNEAQQLYNIAIKMEPNNANYNMNYAQFLSKVNEYDKADELYREAIQIEPNNTTFLMNYAQFLSKVSEYSKAEEQYRKVIQIEPNNTTFLMNYAQFLFKINEYDKAEKQYREAIQDEPNNATLLGNYAQFLSNNRNGYDKAEELYRKAIEIEPDHAVNLGNFAVFLTDVRNKYEEAQKFYLKSIKIGPKNGNNLGNYAGFLTQIKAEYVEAEQVFCTTILIEPYNNPNIGDYALILTYFRNEFDEAEKLYSKAIQMEPDNATYIGNFARFLTNIRGNHEEAEKLYREAINIEPENENNQILFAGFLLAKGNNEEGFQLLTQAENNFNTNSLSGLISELWFYRYCHDISSHPDSLSELKKSLSERERSPWGYLKRNLERAEIDGHPNIPLLRALDSVITDIESIKILDEFQEWREA